MGTDYMILKSGTDIIQKLPTGENFNLSMITGWEELDSTQQVYLQHYLASALQKTLSAYNAGVTPAKIAKLRADSPTFNTACEEVESLFAESLRSVHIIDSFSNSKIRKGTLQALNAEGFESKTITPNKVQNNLIVADGKKGLKDIIDSLKFQKNG